MSHFTFKAKKANGEVYDGEKDANDRYELYRTIREEGDEVIDVKEKSSRTIHSLDFLGNIFKHVKTVEKINFARNLGSMLEAGLALSRALSVLARQTRNKSFKAIIESIISDVGKGTNLSDALSGHPKIFSQLFISMVHAGEQSGTLAESLKVVASQMDSSYSLERRIKGALIYPTVIVFAMVIIAILMFIFVIPTLLKTFTELNVPLPITTRIILGISTMFQQYGLWVLMIFLCIVAGMYWWMRTSSGKNIIHSLVLKLPIVGSLLREVNAARTGRTLSSLLGSGVNVVESVDITAGVVQNIHFRAVLEQARDAIKKGELMSSVFDKHTKLYPIFLVEMMSVGEETGKIGDMLLGVARYYEDDVAQKTKDMSTVIEPILMIIIAVGVGFFAIAMISPMYSLVNAI